MAVRGIDYDQQLVTAKDMAHFMWQSYGKKNGVTKGCTMSYTSSDITIQAGYFLCYGRLNAIDGTETVSIPTVASGTLYCYLVYEIDLSKTNTSSQFNQGYFKIVQNYDAWPTLTQQNLDDHPTDGVYQMPFARFTVTINGMANWTDLRPTFTGTAIVEFLASGWSASAPYSQTVSNSSIIGSAAPGYDVYLETGAEASWAAQKEAFGYVGKMVTTQGGVTLYCPEDKPTVNFKIQISEV